MAFQLEKRELSHPTKQRRKSDCSCPQWCTFPETPNKAFTDGYVCVPESFLMLGHYLVLPLRDGGTLVRLLEACSWKQYWDLASSSFCFQPPQGAYLSTIVPVTKPCTTPGPKVRGSCKRRLRPLKPWAKVNTHSMNLTCLKCFTVVATGELNLGNTECTTCIQSLQQTPIAGLLLITVFWTITCPPSI